jgi:CRISPR/Cas system type I-B associated protein Csh2 (Cas7 group RAMP superfamily)
MFNEVKGMLKDARQVERKIRYRVLGMVSQVLYQSHELVIDLQREITRKL